MRLFYDVFTNRRRAELTLLAADFLRVAAAVLFASGAIRRQSWATDVSFILLWSMIPRGIAGYLRWFDRPREFLRSLVLSTVLVLIVGVLTFSGWELIWEAAAYESRPRVETAVVILLAWASGFLLCIPRGYRLNDFLIGAVVLLGLLERKPDAILWIPLFFLGFLLSATTRRLLYDVFPKRRSAPVNLQNARALSLLGALACTVIFSVLSLGLRGILGERSPRWKELGLFRRGTLSGPSRDGGVDERGSAYSGRLEQHDGGGGVWGRSGDRRTGGPPGPFASREARSVGFSHRVGLSDLARPRYDPSGVLVARLVDEMGKEIEKPPDFWVPHTLLWKGITLSRFDPATNSWKEGSANSPVEWPRSGGVLRTTPVDPSKAFRMEILVLKPVFHNLVAPYFTSELGPVKPCPPGSYYLVNRFGDLFPVNPGIRKGSRYYARVNSWEAVLSPLPSTPAYGPHRDERYLEVPSPDEVGVDLNAESRRFRGGSIQDIVDRLEVFFRRSFRYNDTAFWRGDARRLRTFLLEEKVGDCVYFATASALLLRASGVSTRTVVGFRGGQVDARRPGRVHVKNLLAHSWVEIYLPEAGWFPIDPTGWVKAHADYVPPVELAGASAPSGDSWTEAPPSADPDEVREEKDGGPSPEVAGSDRRDWPEPEPLARSREDPSEAERPDVFALGLLGEEESEDVDSWISSVFTERPTSERASGAGDGPWSPLDEWAALRGRSPSRDALRRGGLRSLVLRSSLLVLAVVAAGLVLLTFLKPKKDAESEEDEEEEKESADDLALAELHRGDFAPGSAREEVLLFYHHLQRDLMKARNHRLPHETPREHGLRFGGLDDELDRAFSDLHESVYRALYGRRDASQQEASAVKELCRRIRRRLG